MNTEQSRVPIISTRDIAARKELAKAKEIAEQLKNSIDWLKSEAERADDYQKKSDLLMEVEAANRELTRITKEINKVEKLNE